MQQALHQFESAERSPVRNYAYITAIEDSRATIEAEMATLVRTEHSSMLEH